MATFDLGRVTPLYKGDYSASTSYELNDVVLYDGNLYWHHKPTATVGVLPTDTTVWGVIFTDEGVRAEIRGYADDAQESADSAQASKLAAATSASNASASASQAALSAQTAQTAETGATASAQTASTKASEASASASSAASSAQSASDSADTATQAKTAAINNAQLAVTKADEARNSATAAANSASTATTKASEASASATTATTKASEASASATAAAASESNAAASEANAQSYAEDAATYLNSFPTDTASGAIASFTDGADNVPVKSLVVNIDPVQDTSSGDPSPENICPISGWTGANVVASGKNLLPNLKIQNSPSTVGIGQTEYVSSTSKIYLSAGTYTLSTVTTASGRCYYKKKGATGTAIGSSAQVNPNGTFTITETGFYAFWIYNGNGFSADDLISFQLEKGSTATDYEPYTGQTISINWESEAGTVYGGTLDVTNGVLTVDKASMTVASAGLNGMANGMQIVSATPSDKAYGVDNAMSNLFATGTSGAYTVNGNASNVRVDFRIPMAELGITESDSSSVRQGAVNEWLANHSTQLVYGITPITYSLTPTEVKSLLGQNNVWADTGDTSVVYRADTSAYIAKKIAEAISALS